MKKIILICSIFMMHFASGQNASQYPYSWITGTWVGNGFGGISEEVWSEPSSDGVIMGSFRHTSLEGVINFYEFFLLDSTGLKLKHFNPDFSGWEEKEKFVHFKMIEVTENAIVLKGLVYERLSDTEMEIRLDLKEGDKKWTEVFKMQRR